MRILARYWLVALATGLLALLVLPPVLTATLAYANPTVRARQGGVVQAPFDRPAPEPSYATARWQRHHNQDDGYDLALPPGWQVLPLDASVGPLAAWVRERSGAGQGFWLAAAPGGTPGDATTINIVRQALSEEMTVEAFARANIQALRNAGSATVVSEERIELSEGRALRTQVTYSQPDGQEPLALTQVYLVNGQDGYVVTAVTRPEQAEDYAPVFEAIIHSLRWTA